MTTEDPYQPPTAPLESPGGGPKGSIRLEPKKIIAGAIVFTIEKRKALAKALLVPFTLYSALDFVYLLEPNFAIALLFQLLGLAIHTVFAITTHRLILLGEGAVPEWGLRSWTKRESFFLIHVVAVALCTIPGALVAIVPIIGWLTAPILIAWIMSRLSLVFPGVAIDQGVTIPLAWRLSRNHQLPLIVTVVIFPVVLGIPTLLLSFLPMTSVPVSLLSTLTTVFTIAALSLSYREVQRLEYGG